MFMRILQAVLVLGLATSAAAWPAYIGVETVDGHRLLKLDEDGSVSDVTVRSEPMRDIIVAPDGSVIAGLADGRVVRWTFDPPAEEVLAAGFARISSVEASPTGIYVADGWRGVYFVALDGSVLPVYEDPAPLSHAYRYEGLVRSGSSLFVVRRPFLCFSEPSALLEFEDTGAFPWVPVVSTLPFHSRDATSAGARLAVTDYQCEGTEDLHLFDPATGATTSHPFDALAGTTLKLATDERGRVMRASDNNSVTSILVIDRIDLDTMEREVIFGLHGRLEGFAYDARDPLQRLGCDEAPRNHGDFVSCVAHRTKELVRAGRMDSRTRADLIRAAAGSDVGKR